MKRTILISSIFFLTVVCSPVKAQNSQAEYLGLPGDNLNLYAVMKLFQESETLEGFERSLNNEKTGINNLDLNGDNLVDYIMVTDYVEGKVHQIVLRVAVTPQETQDVAVFTVERFSNGNVEVQLIGDEALYGRDYIVEPVYSDQDGETPNPGYLGSYRSGDRVVVYRTNHYVVADWPIVSYIYLPGYMGWHSPWYWGCSFSWWSPWNSWSWHYYYGYHSHWYPHYNAHFRIVNRYRCSQYHNYYYSNVRSWSHHVSDNIREGRYRSTYNHPEQRREGEARFASSYPDRVRDSRNLSGSSSSARRSNYEGVRQQQRSTGSSSGLERGRATSGEGNYSGTSSSGRRNDQVNRSESTMSRQRTGPSVSDRNTTVTRKSATVPDRSRYSGNSSGSVRGTSSRSASPSANRENPSTYSRSDSRTSAPSVSGKTRSSVSRSESPSPSRERVSSSGRSSSSGSSSGSGSLKSASRSSKGSYSSSGRSSGRSSGSVSSSSSGGSRSSVSSRSSGGSSRSSGSGSSGGGRSGSSRR